MIYGSRTDADSYFALRDLENVWSSFTNTQKDQALQIATDQIDSLEYAGQKFSGTEQSLQFPRIVNLFASREQHVWDVERPSGDIIVPVKVEEAAYEQARFLLMTRASGTAGAGMGSLMDKLSMGLTSISIGRTSESYDQGTVSKYLDRRSGLFRGAKNLLEEFLLRWY